MKPNYSFFANTKFALQGVCALFQNEKSFRIELCIIIPALILDCFLPLSILEHLFLAFVLFVILIVEAINTAIEANVDLGTESYDPKAKIAKDCASAAVFFSVTFALLSWGIFLGKLWIEG